MLVEILRCTTAGGVGDHSTHCSDAVGQCTFLTMTIMMRMIAMMMMMIHSTHCSDAVVGRCTSLRMTMRTFMMMMITYEDDYEGDNQVGGLNQECRSDFSIE